MRDTEEQVLKCLQEDGGALTAQQIAEELNAPQGDVEDALPNLSVLKRVKTHLVLGSDERTYRSLVLKDAKPLSKPPAPEPVVHRCPECSFSCPTTRGLKLHMARMHQGPKVPEVVVPAEGATTTSPEDPAKQAEDMGNLLQTALLQRPLTDYERVAGALSVLRSVDPGATAQVLITLPCGAPVRMLLVPQAEVVSL